MSTSNQLIRVLFLSVFFILVPPTIEEGPTEVAATVNSRTVLMCETLGLPKPEVSWEKNSKIIPLSGPGYMIHRAGSLQFSSVQVGDSGSYRCVAKNAAGTLHRDISLTVQGIVLFIQSIYMYMIVACRFQIDIVVL